MTARRLPEIEVVDSNATRVLIVDDSAVARAILTRLCEESGDEAGDVVVAGAVGNASAAIALLAHTRVDIVLLDIDMPGTDGLTALPDLIRAASGARVLVVSARAAEGGAAAVQAMALGAADTLAKPEAGGALKEFAAGLRERIARLGEMPPSQPADPAPASVAIPQLAPFDLIAIAASTGGIHALSRLLREVPLAMDAPILITQHLPASFMPYFAAQVALLAGRPCAVAADGAPVQPGRILIAPGDAHLGVARGRGGLNVRLTREAAPSGCLPSADPMFDSVARVCKDTALGVTLSGMGRDGAIGARALVAAGGQLLAQDAASSVVWGMPGAVADGVACAVLPPDAIGRAIAKAAGR